MRISDWSSDVCSSDLRPILDLCLMRDDQWGQASRNAVVNAPTVEGGHLDANQVLLREALDAVRVARHDVAIERAQKTVNQTNEEKLKGYLKQILRSEARREGKKGVSKLRYRWS